MKLVVNGNDTEVSDNLNVTELLTELEVKMPDMVTVELNGNILDRQAFDATPIKPGDKLEFLYFMGGGSRLP